MPGHSAGGVWMKGLTGDSARSARCSLAVRGRHAEVIGEMPVGEWMQVERVVADPGTDAVLRRCPQRSSLLCGDAEGGDGPVGMHRGEGSSRWGLVGGWGRVIAAGRPFCDGPQPNPFSFW